MIPKTKGNLPGIHSLELIDDGLHESQAVMKTSIAHVTSDVKRYKNIKLTESNERAQGSLTSPSLSIEKNQSSLNTQDKRQFIRLSHDHEWRNLSPAGIRDVIVRKLFISLTFIKSIKNVRSGFALCSCSTQAREALSQPKVHLFFAGC